MKQDPRSVLAQNLRAMMEARQISARSLAAKCNVAGPTIGYMLNPDARSPNNKSAPAPSLDKIAKVAAGLDTEAWVLLCPDAKLVREIEAYRAIGRSFSKLTAGTDQ